MASIKTILARLTKAQKAQLKEMEAEARKTGSKAKQRDLLAIMLGDPTIAIQPKPGRKPRKSDASPAKRAQQRTRKAKKPEKEPHAEEPTEQASQNQNVAQANHKSQTTRIRRPKATIETIPPSGKATADSDAELAEDTENYGIKENTNNYQEESDASLQLNGMELDHMDSEFNDGFEERWDEDPANQSIVQLQTAITTVMESVDEEEEDDDFDLTGVLIDYRVLGGSKIIRNTTLAASTSFLQFKTIVSKLMGLQEGSEPSLVYQISIAIAKPPNGISTALDEAKDYSEMISTYIQKLNSRGEKEKKNSGKTKGRAAEPKPFQVWILDTSPKPSVGKGKKSDQGSSKDTGGGANGANCDGGLSGNLEFMGEVRQHFPCTNHRSGPPCYPTPDGCCRFTAPQMSRWNQLVTIKKVDEFGNRYTTAKIPAELGITMPAARLRQVQGQPGVSASTTGPTQSQDRLQLPVPSIQSGSRATSPQSNAAPQAPPSSYFGNFKLPPAPPSAIVYPKLSEWLKGLDENPARAREEQKFGLAEYIAAFKDYGWEKLDDLLDSSVTASLIVVVIKDSLVQGQPMKPGSAAALLRWAKQDAKAIEEGASLHLLGDYITTPHWSR